MSTPLLSVRDLSVVYHGSAGQVPAVREVSFDVAPAGAVALVGESGSGKTTTIQTLLGLLPPAGERTGGQVDFAGADITGWSPKQLRAALGTRIGYVPQDPNNSLNPVRRVGDNLAEVLRIHKWGDRKAIRARVAELLDRVGIPEPELRARQYPHELSGGMKQRVLIASAIALDPELIVADEATSALDVTVQRRVLDLLDDLRAESGTAILLVTHDLAVAADRADDVVVLSEGAVQESGPTGSVLRHPEHPYTRQLLRDAPAFAVEDAPEPPGGQEVVQVQDLVKEFTLGRRRPPFRAVDQVSFTVTKGSTHALVGESGSGKTTTARLLLGFEQPTSGSISVAGQRVDGLRGKAWRQMRATTQMVYQNPFSSLDPRQDIETILTEPLRNFGIGDPRQRRARVREQLDQVALPEAMLARRPGELSGGQRQRVAIARALVLEPEVVVLDEPVSALDVTVQAQILRLLADLQRDLGVTYVFISHDLAVVRRLAHTVSVLQHGKVVESGPVREVFTSPRQAYTQELIAAIPGQGQVAAATHHDETVRTGT
ncbi:dipeptide ABC transporter ATP-binding protein [Pseudactinotalea sp. Z1748]|uniref:dipeptide ABC transporter ATP-binding protein n=1 Tax=Pseudactinotalea sp. Z1748 TaxID=3413027 RepID=UPI003C7B47B7